jgi:hypothetical protein
LLARPESYQKRPFSPLDDLFCIFLTPDQRYHPRLYGHPEGSVLPPRAGTSLCSDGGESRTVPTVEEAARGRHSEQFVHIRIQETMRRIEKNCAELQVFDFTANHKLIFPNVS